VSAMQYLIAHLCSSASDIFSEGFSKMLDSRGRKCYPGVAPGWVGREEGFSLFCCELVPSPTRESLPPVPARPNRRPKCAQGESGMEEVRFSENFLSGKPFYLAGRQWAKPKAGKSKASIPQLAALEGTAFLANPQDFERRK